MEQPSAGPAPDLGREERVRFGWAARLFGQGLALYLRLVARTARVSGPPVRQEQVVFAIWHESNLVAAAAAYRLRRGQPHVSFSTRRFRGIVMNTMLRGLGWEAVTLPDPGAGSRAEATSVSRAMARVAREGKSLVASCDGPTGPYRVAKPGVLILARESGVPVLLNVARSVGAAPTGSYQVTELVRTTAEGWGETSLATVEQVEKDPRDLPGPVSLGVAVESSTEEGKKPLRLVVLGDSDLATNQLVGGMPANAVLLANSLNWLAEREALLTIPPKKTEHVRLNLTGDQLRTIYLTVLLLLPGLAIVLGTVVWVRRRR